jgi:hypothetical protein
VESCILRLIRMMTTSRLHIKRCLPRHPTLTDHFYCAVPSELTLTALAATPLKRVLGTLTNDQFNLIRARPRYSPRLQWHFCATFATTKGPCTGYATAAQAPVSAMCGLRIIPTKCYVQHVQSAVAQVEDDRYLANTVQVPESDNLMQTGCFRCR